MVIRASWRRGRDGDQSKLEKRPVIVVIADWKRGP